MIWYTLMEHSKWEIELRGQKMSPVHLPPASTPFVGRARELEHIVGLLTRPSCRLLTLVGAGGIGKTRLALQVATSQQAHFVDGVAFVALTSIDAPDFVP